MKVEFLENDTIIIHIIRDIDISNRNNLGVLLKEIGVYLKRKYHYLYSGLYNVSVYQYLDYFVFEIHKISNSSSIDFNISFHPNSLMLFEFLDEDYILGKKYYLDGKYYVDFKIVSSCFDNIEFGKVIYKEEVENIMRKAIIVS